ncbi:cell wall protein PRY3-like isoform X2 [Actinia tenebrosa]|nr:cell wall protein PRY3-like isoform X2 [Actinia tenebrosa]XP_031549607.1 cell wall protein PRY3-like isoform X2 [Actinia tenebrosa]
MDVFARKSLEAHNKYRAQHNVQALTWSNSIAREAEAWAKTLAKKGKLMHNKDRKSGEGENIFMSSAADFESVGADATDSWYSEVEKYDFKRGGHQPQTGHFTQVVWKESTELGMGRAKSKNGMVFVVARYKPAGNNLRDFDNNVLPKVSSGQRSPGTNNEINSAKQPQPAEQKPTYKDENKGMSPINLTIKPTTVTLDGNNISNILQSHNKYRVMHDAAPLKWSEVLARTAQAWAEKIAREGRLVHASREDRYYKGENICRMCSHFNTDDAIRIWYSERSNYDYDKPGFDLSTGHFTQIVWRDTREVGVGMAKSPDGKLTYMVARYNPPGNILNRFEVNVVSDVQ